MQDRVPLYPGRVKLTPVSGQENTYDMVRADEPTQEGDPLSKATFLKDATAALFGLDATAVPDDALSLIKTMIDSANNNANTKAKIATGSYTGTGKAGSGNKNTLTFSFAPKVVFVGTPDYRSRGIFISASQYGDVKSTTNISNTAVGSFGVALTWSGNSVSWYNESFDEYQLNMSGKTYNYIAIG